MVAIPMKATNEWKTTPHDFGTGSGIIKEVGKYTYKNPNLHFQVSCLCDVCNASDEEKGRKNN
jgi:hypothetical protein